VSDRKNTIKIDLPGGQDRLKQMILYIARRCENTPRFGGIKLNKILWKSDFDSYATRGIPVTGRAYQRLKLGPAPKEMVPVRRELLQQGAIRIERVDFGDDIVEQRPVALAEPNMSYFTDDDIKFVEAAIDYYWHKTGEETSDDSHGAAWLTRADQEPMPYESAILSDRRPKRPQMERLKQIIYDRGYLSE
jgi:hypothetical protein